MAEKQNDTMHMPDLKVLAATVSVQYACISKNVLPKNTQPETLKNMSARTSEYLNFLERSLLKVCRSTGKQLNLARIVYDKNLARKS